MEKNVRKKQKRKETEQRERRSEGCPARRGSRADERIASEAPRSHPPAPASPSGLTLRRAFCNY